MKNHLQVASLIVTFFLEPTRSVGRGCDLTGIEGLARKGSCNLSLIREMLTPLGCHQSKLRVWSPITGISWCILMVWSNTEVTRWCSSRGWWPLKDLTWSWFWRSQLSSRESIWIITRAAPVFHTQLYCGSQESPSHSGSLPGCLLCGPSPGCQGLLSPGDQRGRSPGCWAPLAKSLLGI